MTNKSKKVIDTAGLSPYELVFKATNDVLYDLDLQAATVRWNEALYTQYGYVKSPEVNTLEWWTHQIYKDDALEVERRIAEWLEGEDDTWEVEYRFAKADGSYNYVRDRGYVIRLPDGTPKRIIGSFLDITHQKQLEHAKDEFISLVSHQLRTPLSVIRTYGEMLESGLFGEVEPSQKAQIQRMTGASIKLTKLVSDILDISKIELDRISIRPLPTDINELIDQYIQELLPVAKEKGVKVLFTPQKSIKEVCIDPMIFGQILQNFLSNGVKYAHTQGGRVDVKFEANQTGYTLSVSDYGIGIPKKSQGRIFERFYRASNASNIEESGTGLGLYIVKILSEACGGSVWFKSIYAKQTTFFFHLPKQGMTVSTPV